MNRYKLAAVLLAAWCLSPAAMASQTFERRVSPIFSYQDFSTNCTNDAFYPGEVYLTLEMQAGTVFRGAFIDRSGLFFQSIALNENELSGISFYTDKVGRAWLEGMTLDARLLNWFFFHSGGCRPSQPLLTLGPGAFRFLFDTEGLGELVFVSPTPTGRFFGQRKDGSSYSATLKLEQGPKDR